MNTFLILGFTIYSWAILAIIVTLLAVPIGICLLFPERYLADNRFFCGLTQLFYWACINLSGLKISYQGHLQLPEEPCIIVANHQSSFDIPLIGYALGDRAQVWLAWAELRKMPFLRIVLPRLAILVDPSSPGRAARSLVDTINIANTHPWDIVIFPEGGRFTDGKVHDFFAGFALLAKKTKRPVVPIKIVGVNNVYPPNTWFIIPKPIWVIVGKPFILEDNETEQAFTQRIYHWFTATEPHR